MEHVFPSPKKLIDREQALYDICHLLMQERLVTLCGPGGIGKTHLAINVASSLRSHFTDGIYFLDLENIKDPSLFIAVVANFFSLEQKGSQTTDKALKAFIRTQNILLVLDNFEQIIPISPLLADLLDCCPELALLVTSRIPLRVRYEHIYHVPPLRIPHFAPEVPIDLLKQGAVSLVIENAKKFYPAFELSEENAFAIVEICRKLEGLPLALELAAARLAVMMPQMLLERLDQRLWLLKNIEHDKPERHSTLRNMLRWSLDLLDPDEQLFFKKLSIFSGSFTLEAVEEICDERSSFLHLHTLLESNLIQRIDGNRFRMMETIRQFAQECLEETGIYEKMRMSHANYYVLLLNRIESYLYTKEQKKWFSYLEVEHTNIRLAWEWLKRNSISQCQKMAVQMIQSLERFWSVIGHINEGCTWTEYALSFTEITQEERAKVLNCAGWLAYFKGQIARAHELCRESLQLTNDKQLSALALNRVGRFQWHLGDAHNARLSQKKSVQIAEELGDWHIHAQALYCLGVIAFHEGEYQKARLQLEESLKITRKNQNIFGEIWTLLYLCQVLYQYTDFDTASKMLNNCLENAQRARMKECAAFALALRGKFAGEHGKIADAISDLRESVRIFQELDHPLGRAQALAALALVIEDSEEENRYFEESIEIIKKVDNCRQMVIILGDWIKAKVNREQYTEAQQLWREIQNLRDQHNLSLTRKDFEIEEIMLSVQRKLRSTRTKNEEELTPRQWEVYSDPDCQDRKIVGSKRNLLS